MNAQASLSYKAARKDHSYWGRVVESAVGAYLLNSARGTQIELFYWREGNYEVDFVLKYGKSLTAIEVKSENKPLTRTGIDQFVAKFKPSKVIVVGSQGISIEHFFRSSIMDFIE